jgi:hypothetical protein
MHVRVKVLMAKTHAKATVAAEPTQESKTQGQVPLLQQVKLVRS